MTIRWTGAFASTDLPVGMRVNGWSEYTTAVDSLKPRFRDGDPVSAAVWFEMYGNANWYYNRSRQRIWSDVFVTTSAGDPTKNNTATDWADPVAIYALTPTFFLYPSAMRGTAAAPKLGVKIRARKGSASNAAAAAVRG